MSRVAPVLDVQAAAGALDRLKIFGVSSHEWQGKSNGNGGDQTIRKFDNRALHAGCRFDGRGLQIVGGSWAICSFWFSQTKAFWS
jgi:hypothetical protein